MQIFKLTISVASMVSVALLSGCANHSETAYLKESQQVKPLQMPSGINLKDEQNYYPVQGRIASPQSTTTPSLVPPGSDLQRFEESKNTASSATTSTAAAAPASLVKWSQSAEGEPVLVLLESQDKAWRDVGRALKATDYQVLDKDRTMSSYYILDTKATSNKITEKTPIYRVYVQADRAAGTAKVSLLSEQNQPVKASVAKQILQLLEQNLA